ncbi:MAG: sugar phosphate isomerase/epimerase family protein [Candidatus Humimicrobiaceae bacterium]
MKEDICEYARIGLVHHMLYPEGVKDPDYHVETLLEFIQRKDIETFDCYIPYGEERRRKVIDRIRNCGKEVVYDLHTFPSRKISLGSLCPQEQGLSRIVIKDQLNIAAAIGATGFVFASGADLPENRNEAKKCFADFCKWFCSELKPHGIDALLEPFDRTIDKKFLLGPIDECVEFLDSLSNEVNNIGFELDFAHLPLMGEDFEYSIFKTAPYLKRVHLGNCVLRDKNNPLYGDQHPPIGIEGGEIDIAELIVILRGLLKIGYIDKDRRGALVLEMTPFPGKSVEYTINNSFERLEKAWEKV